MSKTGERNYADNADTGDGRVIAFALQDLRESLDGITEQLRIANIIALGLDKVPDGSGFGMKYRKDIIDALRIGDN